jgi:pSer/pThr/pTyr-binding forkhead associated (FHA) protein
MSIEVTWRPAENVTDVAPGRITLTGKGPFQIGRSSASEILLDHSQVSRKHASVTVDGDAVTLDDDGSQNGTLVRGQRISSFQWRPGVEVAVGPFILTYRFVETRVPVEATRLPGQDPAARPTFPGRLFDQRQVSFKEIQASGRMTQEVEYLAIGGGNGSFAWVDHLRIFGVDKKLIRVIGIADSKSPHSKYSRLCRNSQIPDHERIRSNSISTPDNIWGFPGYASRETVRSLARGQLVGLKYVFQVFGEPTVSETYTPRLDDVVNSIDREAKRIGWEEMWITGRVIAIRKTDDERYVIAYRASSESESNNNSPDRDRFIVARYIHIATGYPASNFLDDLQKFRREHPQSTAVVNCYEEHDDVYRTLEQRGGTVLIRGRGIVASRIIQRLYEARQKNSNIQILQQLRSQITEGSKWDLAQREVHNDTEHQPFNWPKSCWGGNYLMDLDRATPEERSKMMAAWGGTTTADRDDWLEIIATGKKEGWFKVFYGEVESMSERGSRVVTRLQGRVGYQENLELVADYVIDCTGLIAKIDESPLIADLIKTYDMPRNRVLGKGPEGRLSGLSVSSDFELAGLQNGRGRAYAAGVLTFNGPYAAVDSFLGLQYAALRSVDHLASLRAPGVSRFGPLRSSYQWLKWCAGASP